MPRHSGLVAGHRTVECLSKQDRGRIVLSGGRCARTEPWSDADHDHRNEIFDRNKTHLTRFVRKIKQYRGLLGVDA